MATATASGALVLGAWSGVMLALPFLEPPGRLVAVVGDGPGAIKAIAAAGGRIVEVRRGATLARGSDAGFVRALYANGALAVVVARATAGCGGA